MNLEENGTEDGQSVTLNAKLLHVDMKCNSEIHWMVVVNMQGSNGSEVRSKMQIIRQARQGRARLLAGGHHPRMWAECRRYMLSRLKHECIACHSTTVLRPYAHGGVRGFSSGRTQRNPGHLTDCMRTCRTLRQRSRSLPLYCTRCGHQDPPRDVADSKAGRRQTCGCRGRASFFQTQLHNMHNTQYCSIIPELMRSNMELKHCKCSWAC